MSHSLINPGTEMHNLRALCHLSRDICSANTWCMFICMGPPEQWVPAALLRLARLGSQGIQRDLRRCATNHMSQPQIESQGTKRHLGTYA